MRKPELAAAIAAETGLSKDKSSEVITLLTDHIGRALGDGDSVTIPGFGTFTRRSRAERRGKNPRTGEEITIPASNSVGFRPGKSLKDLVR